MRAWVAMAIAGSMMLASAPAHAQPDVPADIRIDDPLLTPPPRAGRVLTGWDQIRALAESRATDLREARAERERAEGEARAVLGAVLPQIGAEGTATRTFLLASDDSGVIGAGAGAGANGVRGAVPMVTTETRGAATLVQPIVDIAKWHQLGIASTEVEASRLSLADARRRVLRAAAQALLASVAASRAADLARADLRGALERAQLVTRRRQLESATELDVLRARQDVHAARLAVIGNEEARRRADDALALTLGVPGPIGIAPEIPIAAIASSVARECPSTAVEGRADIAALRARVDAAQSRVSQVGLEQLPTLRLVGQLGVDITRGDGGAGTTTFWSAGAAVTVPIWDGGTWYGVRRARAADAEIAALELSRARREAATEIAQTHREVAVAIAAVAIARDAHAEAVDLERLERERFRRGSGTTLELTLAAAALRKQAAELARREVDVVEAQLLAQLAAGACAAR